MLMALKSVAALLLSAAFLYVSHGLQTTLIPLRASAENFSTSEIGWIGSSVYIGFFIGSIATPHIIMRSGHIRTFTALVSLASAAALLHPLLISPFYWTIFRVILGLCMSGIYIVMESWLNERATNETRGQVFSAYMLIFTITFAIGQMMVSVTDIKSNVLFIICSIIFSIAVIPLALTRSEQPAPVAIVQLRPVQLFLTSPTAYVGVFTSGCIFSSFTGLSQLYFTDIGYSVQHIALFMTIAILGGALCQWPAGKLSDLMDRRYVLIAIGLVGLFASTAFWMIETPDYYTIIGLVALLGFLMTPVYSIAAAHAFDLINEDQYVETASGLLIANAIGAVSGPIAASLLMEFLDLRSLFLFIMVIVGLFVAQLVLRLNIRTGPIVEEKTDFDYSASAMTPSVLPPEPTDEVYSDYDDIVMYDPTTGEIEDYSTDEDSDGDDDNDDDEDDRLAIDDDRIADDDRNALDVE